MEIESKPAYRELTATFVTISYPGSNAAEFVLLDTRQDTWDEYDDKLEVVVNGETIVFLKRNMLWFSWRTGTVRQKLEGTPQIPEEIHSQDPPGYDTEDRYVGLGSPLQFKR